MIHFTGVHFNAITFFTQFPFILAKNIQAMKRKENQQEYFRFHVVIFINDHYRAAGEAFQDYKTGSAFQREIFILSNTALLLL